MGQSINTTGLLLTYNKNWPSKWYNEHNYTHIIYEDMLIREYVSSALKKLDFFYSKCIIKRSISNISVHINIYNKKRKLNKENKSLTIKKDILLEINNTLVKLTGNQIKLFFRFTNNFDAQILAQYIAKKIETPISFQNIFNKIIVKLKRVKGINKIKGLRLQCSGRPNGNDMASIQWFKHGQTPLHTYNSKIDYCYTTALTKYGICGIKVWISFI